MASCTNDDLLSVIDGYIEVTGIPHAAFGRASVGDPWLVTNLRGDEEISEHTANTLLDYVIADLEGRMRPAALPDDFNAYRLEVL